MKLCVLVSVGLCVTFLVCNLLQPAAGAAVGKGAVAGAGRGVKGHQGAFFLVVIVFYFCFYFLNCKNVELVNFAIVPTFIVIIIIVDNIR